MGLYGSHLCWSGNDWGVTRMARLTWLSNVAALIAVSVAVKELVEVTTENPGALDIKSNCLVLGCISVWILVPYFDRQSATQRHRK